MEDETLPQEKKIEKRVKTENGFEWIEKTVNHSGDELVSFEESINMTRASEQLSGSNFLLKNWLKGLTHIAEIVASDFPKDKLERQIKEIQSSVAKSFLLREFLGDCDSITTCTKSNMRQILTLASVSTNLSRPKLIIFPTRANLKTFNALTLLLQSK